MSGYNLDPQTTTLVAGTSYTVLLTAIDADANGIDSYMRGLVLQISSAPETLDQITRDTSFRWLVQAASSDGNIFPIGTDPMGEVSLTLPAVSIPDKRRINAGLTHPLRIARIIITPKKTGRLELNFDSHPYSGGSGIDESYYIGADYQLNRINQGAGLVYSPKVGTLTNSTSGDLSNPTYSLWNGFLGLINVAELVNPGDKSLNVAIALYGSDGTQRSTSTLIIPPRSQQDLVLNDLKGFAANSYGVVEITYQGKLDGRVFYYLQDRSNSNFQFAFGSPFVSPTRGNTAVSFNTMQPSLEPKDAQNQVSNWLSIVNLSKQAQSFSVLEYSLTGELQNSTAVLVSPRGRSDVEAGAGLAPTTGLIQIVPDNTQAPFIAQLMRYGSDSPVGVPPTSYKFAFPLLALEKSIEPIYAPISTLHGEQTWLEVANVTKSPTVVTVRVVAEDGDVREKETFSLPSFAQRHIDASQYLLDSEAGHGEIGHVSISSSIPGSVMAQTMFYFRDANGSIKAMYGSQARAISKQRLAGSYNLFLGMKSLLRLYNVSDDEFPLTVMVGDASEHQLDLKPRSAIQLPLDDSQQFKTTANSYGTVLIEGNGRFIAEILRLRLEENNQSSDGEVIDFVAPTAVK